MCIPRVSVGAKLTPFDDSGRISEPQVRKLVDYPDSLTTAIVKNVIEKTK